MIFFILKILKMIVRDIKSLLILVELLFFNVAGKNIFSIYLKTYTITVIHIF